MSAGESQASRWVTVSFCLPSDALTHLEDELVDLAPDGMQVDDATTLTGAHLDRGTSRVVLYVRPERVAETERELQSLAQSRALSLEMQVEDLEERDWNATWKAHYKPLRIGRRIRVEPVFRRLPEDLDLVSVIIDPGLAFGTGTHETTQLASESLETWIDDAAQRGLPLAETTMLDVGTGSGILAIVALKLGVGRVIGTEIDTPGLENTRDNVKLNGVDERFTALAVESPADVSGGPFPLVVANIISGVLLRLRDALIAQVAPGGTLLLSGVLVTESDDFLKRFSSPRLHLRQRHERGQWSAFVFDKVG